MIQKDVPETIGAVASFADAVLLDRITFETAEIDKLEKSFDARTIMGQSVLHHSLTHNNISGPKRTGRQSAIAELTDRPELRDRIREEIDHFADHEEGLGEFIHKPGVADKYVSMRKGMQSVKSLGAAIETGAEAAESPYLRSLFGMIRSLNESTIASRARGPLYYTATGLRGKEEVSWYTPKLRFRPAISGRFAAAASAELVAAKCGVDPEVLAMAFVGTLTAGMFSLMPSPETPLIKDTYFSNPTAYKPLKKQVKASTEWIPGFSALAELDVITGLSAWQSTVESHGNTTSFANIENGDRYHFAADGMRNPLLAYMGGRQLVANTIELGGDIPLTFVTGPNSGGKSTISKAVVQNQITGQMGGPVVADRLRSTVADTIAYHVPTPPDLDNETGRFGFELGRVRSILDRATLDSLTVLDDCLDGTTHEERLEVLNRVMTAYRYIGGATLFSTHAHELVGDFEDNGVGQFLQVKFADDKPTYRIIPGVSHTSHADRVARMHGFGKDQVDEEVLKKTGRRPDWF